MSTPATANDASECVQYPTAGYALLLSSNTFFLFPILVQLALYSFNASKWKESHFCFSMALACVCVVSTLYHTCAASDLRVNCSGYCVVPHTDLFDVDQLTAGLAAVVAAHYSADFTQETARMAFFATITPFAILSVLIQSAPDYVYLAWVVIVVFMVLCMRFFVLHDLHTSSQHFVAALMPMLSSVTVGIALQYFVSTSDATYPYQHTGWHACMATAACFVPLLFSDSDTVLVLEVPNTEAAQSVDVAADPTPPVGSADFYYKLFYDDEGRPNPPIFTPVPIVVNSFIPVGSEAYVREVEGCCSELRTRAGV